MCIQIDDPLKVQCVRADVNAGQAKGKAKRREARRGAAERPQAGRASGSGGADGAGEADEAAEAD
eukprot:NODE_27689_length_504_cov_3.225464.p2 GENE.NODE_27689_length_504_cov_3.225464~~NODE_27689_length_504_cov_3.225464.p2  ORF type:complete len:65 (+),score=12.46 NODE_27689_length_504_cov_3.225464:165-359(+)